MDSIQALRERRAAKAVEARKLLDDNTGEKWNKSISDKVDALYAEIEALDEQVARYQRLLDLEADKKFAVPKNGIKEGDLDPMSPRALFQKWLRRGDNALNAEEWTVLRNTMSTTTGSEGGNTVQTDVAKEIIEALKAFGGMRPVSDVFSTEQGNPLNFPGSDGTSEVGEIIAENVTATALDPSFTSVALPVYKFSSKIIACPIELLQDSAVDIEAFIRARIVQRLGRIQNQMFTTGTGTAQPFGVVTRSTLGKTGTTGQTLTVIYDDLVDLVHSVDPAYRESGRCRFMMNDSSVKVIRKIKDTAGRPIWTPGYEAGIKAGVPDSLLGYPVQVNQDVAVMAANAKSILFGDFNPYKIRDVMSATLFRFTDSAYTKLGQVGFLAWMRSGGNLVDTGAVKHYANSAT